MSHKSLRATHIVGGEVNYEMLNDTTYLISLKVYRDCYYGVPLFDNPAYIKVFNGNNDSITFFAITRPPWEQLDIVLTNPCLAVPPDVCVEAIDYTRTIVLPRDTTGYQFVYHRCCRNGTIINAIGHDGRRIIDAGATFLAQTPSGGLRNSNPVYNDFPPIALCLGEKIVFDHSATDADGDSLVYKLCTPLHGGDIFGNLGNIGFRPYQYPPYSELIYIPPFSLNNVLGGTDPLKIDTVTGLLTGTPQRVGQFVVGVCVEEYRDGLYLGETKRDFQFNIVECDPKVQGSFEPGGIVCTPEGDFGVQFVNYSSDESNTFLWNFGDGSTSVLKDPYHLFPDTGRYFVTLIANPGSPCSDTLIKELIIREKRVKADFSNSVTNCYNPNSIIQFTDLSTDFIGFKRQLWYFGDGDSSFSKNPIHQYSQSGIYLVTLYVEAQNGCVDFIEKTIDVFTEKLQSDFITTYDCNSGSFFAEFINTTNNNFEVDYFFWDFDDGSTSTTTNKNIFHLFPAFGTYNVKLITHYKNGCKDTVTKPIVIFSSSIFVDFSITDNCENTEVIFTNNSSAKDSIIGYLWDFGDGTTSTEKNPVHTYSNNNFFGNVKLTVFTLNGCQSSQTSFLRFRYLDVDYEYSSADPCFPLNKPILFEPIGFSSTSVFDFFWDFGDGTTATTLGTVKTFTTPGRYNVKFSLRNFDGCFLLIEKEIVIADSINLLIDFTFDRVGCSSNSNTIQFNGNIQTQDNIEFIQWSFGDGEIQTDIQNPVHNYSLTGDYQVFLLVETALGCTKVINKPIKVQTASPIALIDSITICLGDSVVLPLISEGDVIYHWKPSSTLNNDTLRNPTAKPTETTFYQVTVKTVFAEGDTCFQKDSIKVKVIGDFSNQYSLSVSKNPVEPNEQFQLFVVPAQFSAYFWQPVNLVSASGSPNPFASVTQDTWFYAEVTNNLGCKSKDSILVEVEEIEETCKINEAFIPNAFTPDGNGFNDVLFVRNVEAEEFLWIIYNRWGVKVFESRDINQGWDGRFNGVLQSTDVFGYYLRLICEGEIVERKGNVTLVR